MTEGGSHVQCAPIVLQSGLCLGSR
jgi:hypothetical protein